MPVSYLLCQISNRIAALHPKHIRQSGRSFVKDEGGAVAIIFAVSLIPILMLVGAAIDYARVSMARSEAQAAIDAATLAAVKKVALMTDGEVRAMVESFVSANVPQGTKVNIDLVEIERNPSSLKIWGSGETETTVMKLASINKVGFKANSRAVATDKSIELVLVLDNSGSMRYDMDTLYDASDKLVETLEINQQASDGLSIGIVPFNHLVRLDAGHDKASWLDQKAKSSVHRLNLPPKSNRWKLFKTLIDPTTAQPEKWEGCVEARAHPYDIQDTTPSSSFPDSYFVPFFYPSTGEYHSSVKNNYYYRWDNHYLPVPIKKSDIGNNKWKKFGEYYQQTISWGGGPNKECYIKRLLPLTENMTTVRTHLKGMVANGWTNIHMGTIWGLRVLSPQSPYSEGRAYSDHENKKFMIIMTDGANTYTDEYHAYGWASDKRITGSSSTVREMNVRTKESCQAAKTQNIQVFTVYFGNPGGSTEDVMKTCASNEDSYFVASGRTQLIKAFEDIAKAINTIRLTD